MSRVCASGGFAVDRSAGAQADTDSVGTSWAGTCTSISSPVLLRPPCVALRPVRYRCRGCGIGLDAVLPAGDARGEIRW